jgi:hypothetical protein
VEWMGLQRHLKVAGIFARLTLRDGKYLQDAPRFIAYIRATARRYRELGPCPAGGPDRGRRGARRFRLRANVKISAKLASSATA